MPPRAEYATPAPTFSRARRVHPRTSISGRIAQFDLRGAVTPRKSSAPQRLRQLLERLPPCRGPTDMPLLDQLRKSRPWRLRDVTVSAYESLRNDALRAVRPGYSQIDDLFSNRYRSSFEADMTPEEAE